MAFVGFAIRLVVYALLLGLVARYAQDTWAQNGLDHVGRLRHFHDVMRLVVLGAPVVFALFGGRLLGLGVFAVCFIAGALLAAPFVIARAAGV